MRVGPMAVQPLGARAGVLSCRRRHANVPVFARAATTMTPAAVVTADPPTSPTDAAAAAMLGPLGKSLLREAEVHSAAFVHLGAPPAGHNALATGMRLSVAMLRPGSEARP